MVAGDAAYETMPTWWYLTFGVLSLVVVLVCVKVDDEADVQKKRQHGHSHGRQKEH